MPLEISKLLGPMLAAARGEIEEAWPNAKEYAESELRKIGQSLTFIENEVSSGRMSSQKAKLHLDIQKNTAKTVLMTLEGLGILAAEAAINAAMAAVKDTVNTAIGFAII